MSIQKTVKNNLLLHAGFRIIDEIIDIRKFAGSLRRYATYCTQLMKYASMTNEKVFTLDIYPKIHDATSSTKMDPHYFYQGWWAFRKILASGVTNHVDVGSQIDFVRYLSAVMQVTFIDIRPIELSLENLECRKGSILSMPYKDNSVSSLSSLHVLEHIGLGRYGDPLDPSGSLKAAKELVRVLAPGGSLYLSTLTGRARTCFNAHRIWTPLEVTLLFEGLDLEEFSLINEIGEFMSNTDLENYGQNYSLGLFHLSKPKIGNSI